MRRDPRVARRRRQILVAEQNLDDADVDAAFQEMRREAVPQDMNAHPLVDTGGRARRTASGVQDGGLDRFVLVAPGKQKALGSRQTPITAQDAEQLLGQHDVAFLTALAALDPHDHPVAVYVDDLEARHLRNPQTRRIGGGQCDAGLEVGDRFEKPNDLVAAQHRRQFARLAGVGDPFRDVVLAERHAVKETQRADDLVERGPGNALGGQMNLKGADILQPQTVRGSIKISAELRNRVDVGSLGRRRKIADRHILGQLYNVAKSNSPWRVSLARLAHLAEERGI